MDIADNPPTLKELSGRTLQPAFSARFVFFLLFFLYGCHLPKISVLQDPLTAEEHVNLGVAYEKSGELDHALREYQKASNTLPVAYFYLGNAYFQKNELKQAEKFYKKAIAYDEQNADAYNNLAWLYYVKMEKLDEAENLALKAIKLNPEKEEIYLDTLDKIRKAKNL